MQRPAAPQPAPLNWSGLTYKPFMPQAPAPIQMPANKSVQNSINIGDLMNMLQNPRDTSSSDDADWQPRPRTPKVESKVTSYSPPEEEEQPQKPDVQSKITFGDVVE